MENVEVSNKSPPPLLLSHKKQGPRHRWRRGNQQRMNWDTRGWRAMDNNQVSSLLPLPLSHLHRKTRRRRYQRRGDYSTTNDNDAPRCTIPTTPPATTSRTATRIQPHHHTECERPPTKPTAHERRRPPTNKGRRPPTETHARERKRTRTNGNEHPRVNRMRTKMNAQTTTASTHERMQATTSPGE